MKKVCLVIPGSIFLSDERVFPHLGILRIAAVLERDRRYSIDVLDLSGIKNPLDVLESYIKKCDIDLSEVAFGVTSTTPQMPQAAELLQRIRTIAPESRTILGGPHVTALARGWATEKKREVRGRATRAFEDLKQYAHVLIAGDGEESIFLALSEKNPPQFINGDERDSEFFLSGEKFESLPFPARHLIDLDSYHYYINNKKAGSVIWMQGCPFACYYCSGRNSPSFRLARPRTTENIIEEIASIVHLYGYEGIQVYDDEINLVDVAFRQNMRALIDFQLKTGKTLSLRGFVKANLLTEYQVKLMKDVGFHEICVGVEAAHPRILKNINKKATVDDNTQCVELAKKYGMRLKAFCSVGHPGEDFETVLALRDWLIEMRIDDFDCTVISPFPSVPYYDDAVEVSPGVYCYQAPNGDRLFMKEVNYTKESQYFKGDRDLGYVSHVWTNVISAEELVACRDWVENTVRNALHLPFYKNKAALAYDHSYGAIPQHILRSSVAN